MPRDRVSSPENSTTADPVPLSAESDARPASTAPIWDPEGVEDFSLTDRSGKTITRADLLGHPWVACFVFTACAGPCPRVTSQMKQLEEQLKDTDVRLVTFTVDPERDTTEVLTRYADTFRADPERWLFLTGDKNEIYHLIHNSFKMPVQETLGEDRKPGFEIIHSTNIMHVGADGVVKGKYNAASDEEMVRLRRTLLGQPVAPAGGEAGSNADGGEGPTETSPTPGSETADSDSETAPSRPAWVAQLPAVNASLNGLATLLLIAGYVLIKSGKVNAHKTAMLSAFAASIVFLACYLVYHYYAGSKRFEGSGAIRAIYLSILVTHILLAAAVPILAIITIRRGLRAEWESHKRIARITFPIWLYVSVTGVIIYAMLYHWPVSQ